MRQISRKAPLILALSALGLAHVPVATADDVYQNVHGFNLPGVQLPQGADEVRAADGTTCRSAVSGNGAYLDLGVIGTPKSSAATTSARASNDHNFSAYGRVVIPLGRSSKRLDCTELYALEVERLKIELRLMQMGLGNQGQPADSTQTASVPGAPEADDEDVVAADKPTGGLIKGKPGVASQVQETVPATKTAKVTSSKKPSTDWADEGWSTKGKK